MSEQITPNPSVPTQIVKELNFPKYINNLGIIPTSYKDSMSYYECLAWLCKYLEETVIPTLNENGEAVEELQNLYVELNQYVTNYFENLNVQEEINNKMDEMVRTGVLQDTLSIYFNDLENDYNERYINMKNTFTERYDTLEQDVSETINNNNTFQNQKIDQNTTSINVLSNRMDTFTHLAQGSTTGDAELTDIRTMFDGTVKSSARKRR